MAKINKKIPAVYTHEGAKASHINTEQQLRRSVMACMLWENEFYESGESIYERIKYLIPKVSPGIVSKMAIEARECFKLRHVPLLIVREMARHDSHKHLVAETLFSIIQRADELTEFLAIYWKDGKCPLSSQVKRGLAQAFCKFGAYALAKYNRDGAVKLRDVLFLCHAKPKDSEQESLWKQLINNELPVPDTWEVALSTGKDKKETWHRLIAENKLGGLALLRNLRNMQEAGVDYQIINKALISIDVARILPFRFITAAKNNPKLEGPLEVGLLKCCAGQSKLPGKTILIIDVSGSMYGSKMSKYSELDRANAACSLAILVREQCENPVIYATAGSDSKRMHATQLIPSRRGFALSDAIYSQCSPLGGGGIFLKQVMDYVFKAEKSADRIIVITDEQDCDTGNSPSAANAFGKENYIINVASAQNGIAYDKWTHINGFSEAVINYIIENETTTNMN